MTLARFNSSGSLKCSSFINNSFQLWCLHFWVPEQSVFLKEMGEGVLKGSIMEEGEEL